MPDSFLTTVTNRIVTILVGAEGTYFAKQIKPANRFSRLSGVKWPMPPNPNNRNIPKCVIDVSDFRTNANVNKTFGNTTRAIGDKIVQASFTFRLNFVYDGTDAVPNNMAHFLTGVLLADPKLGLTIVATSGDMSGEVKDENNDETGNTLRCVQRIRFPVVLEYHRADLIAAAAFAG